MRADDGGNADPNQPASSNVVVVNITIQNANDVAVSGVRLLSQPVQSGPVDPQALEKAHLKAIDASTIDPCSALDLCLNSAECVEELLADPSTIVDQRAKNKQVPATALFTAVGLGDIKIVSLFVAAGANANVAGMEGFTPLHQAVTNRPEKSEIVALLLSGGAKTEAVWTDETPGPDLGWPATPLSVATQNGFCESSGLLLAAGANPHAIGALGMLPVQTASYLGHPRCLEHLIAHGADVNAQNAKVSESLLMAGHGVRDYLHAIHGAPPTNKGLALY